MSSPGDGVRWNQKVVAGCVTVALLLLFVVGAATVLAFRHDRQLTHYPDARLLTSHSNYGGLPHQFRWDNSYFTTDGFTNVYNWYSVTFDLGAESRAIERCILLEGPADQLVLERVYSILLCNAPEGQYIYVTRTTQLKLP